jgi:RimJ/RimL family protein N-acetyltransferase
MDTHLQTPRLILRRWRPSDREPFRRLNADPRVMEFFPALLSAEESDFLLDRIENHFELYGFGLWATELRENSEFVGFIGLAVPTFKAAFTPCVEIGWRLAANHWGCGLATEGAREVVRYAFSDLGLNSIVSFTTTMNVRSRRVMEKIGMARDPAEDFHHPRLPPDHPLCRHVLYRLSRKTP